MNQENEALRLSVKQRKRMKRFLLEYFRYRTLYRLSRKDARGKTRAYIKLNQFVSDLMKETCNTCLSQSNCQYSPGWGRNVRINCPFYSEKRGEET